ncbi:hypothetical protein DY000_02058737 [Brassica cretica]|uniref:Uncharacterized protein n=1 Tax=Brassica cretica TaxID=69181 RepID=A0ABQ7ATF4_BRACR|nr:hypothetical protein DY000_02058737 [Brassica cretica]
MALEKFGPHLKTILEAKHIEAINELWGVDYTVEIELPKDGETLETVRPGYCGAYMSHFEDSTLSFPLPRFLLQALAELKMEFTQMAPNFFCYFMASWNGGKREMGSLRSPGDSIEGHNLEESERQILRRSSAKITDNVACSYSEISVLSWDFGETFAIRYESFRQRTKVGLIDLVARKTQQLSDLNYESHIGKRFLVDTEGVSFRALEQSVNPLVSESNFNLKAKLINVKVISDEVVRTSIFACKLVNNVRSHVGRNDHPH